MKKLKIMTVCGFGLGSSLVLRMTVDEVLQKHNIKAETFCSDADTAVGQNYDLVITSGEMERLFKDVDVPVIVIDNFLSPDEVEEKALSIIQKLTAEE
ncbi:MAG: PTS sugar transporter subunit IIB [Anaerolineaceae bacterium]|jgi:PTS system ascorbate-specific IIB component|nr:PTS sugar transporter subunit IIB [Anaerolineaceae bacterium]